MRITFQLCVLLYPDLFEILSIETAKYQSAGNGYVLETCLSVLYVFSNAISPIVIIAI